MNQDTEDALARLRHAIDASVRQASLPTDAPTLQAANDVLRGRLEEEIALVAKERARADGAEQEAEYWRKENRATRDAAAKMMNDALELIGPMAVLENERNALRARADATERQCAELEQALAVAEQAMTETYAHWRDARGAELLLVRNDLEETRRVNRRLLEENANLLGRLHAVERECATALAERDEAQSLFDSLLTTDALEAALLRRARGGVGDE